METCHNWKKEVLVVPIVTINSIKHATWAKTQPVKVGKIHVRYPCIIYSIIEHRSKECHRKFKVHNMFRTKHVNCLKSTMCQLM
jgi:hypothetical protein